MDKQKETKKKKQKASGLSLTAQEAAIQKSRAAIYGDSKIQHGNLGLMWTGILRQAGYKIDKPIPSYVVLLMMVACKLSRCAIEEGLPNNGDSYTDGKIYFELAKEAKKYKMEIDTKERKGD